MCGDNANTLMCSAVSCLFVFWGFFFKMFLNYLQKNPLSQLICHVKANSINDLPNNSTIHKFLPCIHVLFDPKGNFSHHENQEKHMSTENQHYNIYFKKGSAKHHLLPKGWVMKKTKTKKVKGENRIWHKRREKQKASWWVAMNSPAKEFSPLKALYISLCKPYQTLGMS